VGEVNFGAPVSNPHVAKSLFGLTDHHQIEHVPSPLRTPHWRPEYTTPASARVLECFLKAGGSVHSCTRRHSPTPPLGPTMAARSSVSTLPAHRCRPGNCQFISVCLWIVSGYYVQEHSGGFCRQHWVSGIVYSSVFHAGVLMAHGKNSLIISLKCLIYKIFQWMDR